MPKKSKKPHGLIGKANNPTGKGGRKPPLPTKVLYKKVPIVAYEDCLKAISDISNKAIEAAKAMRT